MREEGEIRGVVGTGDRAEVGAHVAAVVAGYDVHAHCRVVSGFVAVMGGLGGVVDVVLVTGFDRV